MNRGAGQGDVYGSTACGLSLGERVVEHRHRFRGTREDAGTAEADGAVDEWFIDDGQGGCRVQQEEWTEGLLTLLTWPAGKLIHRFDTRFAAEYAAMF